jgi:hypothetical protein
MAQGRCDEAETSYRRALGIRERVLSPHHIAVAASSNDLAELYATEGRIKDALAASGRAVTTLEENLTAGTVQSPGGGFSDLRTARLYFTNYVRIASVAAEETPEQTASTTAAAFRSAQLAEAVRQRSPPSHRIAPRCRGQPSGRLPFGSAGISSDVGAS